MLRPADHLTKRYQGILDMFELTQIVKRPTRVTRTSKTLIDHFITNHPQKVTNTGIIPCSIVSDHDAVYACVNVRLPRFQPPYKFIRDIRNFKEDVFKEDFSSLPLSVISYSDDPDEQLETLNTINFRVSRETSPIAEGTCHAATRSMDEGPIDRGTNEMLPDLPLTRPALTLLGMSFVRSGIN